MSHAHHFLTRLDRVSLPHVELALGLYNDAGLLQYILHNARLPERADRVAISLHHPEEGPFIVVTREGRFVTCLGEGMSTGQLPVVTRGQLDAMAHKVGALRACLDECRAIAGPNGGVRKLVQRVHEAADELSREEMVTLAGLAPLYSFEFFHFLMAAINDLADAREVLGQQLKRTDRLKPQFREPLRAFHRTFWSIGHFAVLSALDGKAGLAQFPKPLFEALEQASLSWGAVRQGNLALALKGIWAVARMGKPLLPSTKVRFRNAASPLTYLDSAMGLTALGLRHNKLLAEVRKELAAGPALPKDHVIGRQLHAMNGMLLRLVEDDEAFTSDCSIYHAAFGATVWKEWSRRLPPGAPLRFDRVEDFPVELAKCIAVNANFDFLSRPMSTIEMHATLPWVARATPEMLYLPRAVLEVVHEPWAPEHSLPSLRSYLNYYKRHTARPSGPARQGPCPCGSGKKFKRCCEEVEAES